MRPRIFISLSEKSTIKHIFKKKFENYWPQTRFVPLFYDTMFNLLFYLINYLILYYLFFTLFNIHYTYKKLNVLI